MLSIAAAFLTEQRLQEACWQLFCLGPKTILSRLIAPPRFVGWRDQNLLMALSRQKVVLAFTFVFWEDEIDCANGCMEM